MPGKRQAPYYRLVESATFDGTYDGGTTGNPEPIAWRIESTRPSSPRIAPGFEIRTSIRGVGFSGSGFDTLDPESEDEAQTAGLTIGPMGLTECVLTGRLPCTVVPGDAADETTVNFVLDLRAEACNSVAAPQNLRLSLGSDLTGVEIVDDWFEDGLLRLEAALPNDTRLRCCVTCLYSDYSPGGHGLIGMSCHRDAKEQYLAVTSKADYWSVPVAEEVVETYYCHEYARRIPGTGYRG